MLAQNFNRRTNVAMEHNTKIDVMRILYISFKKAESMEIYRVKNVMKN